ncbi:MAG: NTP/NDP exchange transporter [Gemmatimonadaceae bacterium]
MRDGEVRATLLSFAYFFFVLGGWYILRPIRDELAAAGGTRSLPYLFLGTLAVTLVVNPFFSKLVTMMPRRRFVPITYRFFAAVLVLFYALYRVLPEDRHLWLGRVFFVWTTVVALFITSVFWGHMADVWRSEQGKRLFGFIGAGGTLGGIAGSAVTALLAERLGTPNLLLVTAVAFELAVQCVHRLGNEAASVAAEGARDELGATAAAESAARAKTAEGERPVEGGVWGGFAHVVRSPYLLGICLYMLLFTIGSTFLYFQQSEVVGASIADREARTAYLARLDLIVNALALFTQLFITGRVIRGLGVRLTLALVPLLSIVGFAALASTPAATALVVLAVVQVSRRAGEFAIGRPAREVLFTVVGREDKYKAKSLIDTFVYRGGDQLGAWSYALVATTLGLGVVGAAWVAVPLSAAWLAVSLWLGRRQQQMAAARAGGAPAEAPAAAITAARPA